MGVSRFSSPACHQWQGARGRGLWILMDGLFLPQSHKIQSSMCRALSKMIQSDICLKQYKDIHCSVVSISKKLEITSVFITCVLWKFQ